jgi:hypothetical protein
MFSFFEKVYCINLSSRVDRWDNCLKQFSKFGVSNIQRFEAIKYNHPKLSAKANAHIGCVLSHCNIIKEAKLKNYSNILVLEDDFLFLKEPYEFEVKLKKSLNELPSNWDLFYLGSYFVKGYGYEPIERYSDNLVKVNTGFCTHSLAYSSRGMDKILKSLKLNSELDILNYSEEYESIAWYLVREFQYENNCFASDELLSSQMPGFSDIEGKFLDYFKYLSSSYSEFLGK